MNITEASEFAARWAENQRGMVVIAETLKDLGSMEQATAERKKALEAATKAHEAKVAELQEAHTQLENLRKEHAATIDAHVSHLDTATEQATAQAALIIANAQRRAAEMIDAAKADEQRIRDGHAAIMAGLRTEIEAAQRDLMNAKTAVTSLLNDHSDLTAKIEQMKAAARGVLG